MLYPGTCWPLGQVALQPETLESGLVPKEQTPPAPELVPQVIVGQEVWAKALGAKLIFDSLALVNGLTIQSGGRLIIK